MSLVPSATYFSAAAVSPPGPIRLAAAAAAACDQLAAAPPSRFLGESREAEILALFQRGGLTNGQHRLYHNPLLQKALPVSEPVYAAVEGVMKRKVDFPLGGHSIPLTYQQVLEIYGGESVKIFGSRAWALVGTPWVGEELSVICPTARSLLTIEPKSHLDRYSDTDTIIKATSSSDGHHCANRLPHALGERFWMERIGFRVQFSDATCVNFQGFRALVEFYTQPLDQQKPLNPLYVNNIVATAKTGLEEKRFKPEHLIKMMDSNRRGELLKDLYPEMNNYCIFDEWHYFRQERVAHNVPVDVWQCHRMSCRDTEGDAYDFTIVSGQEERSRRVVFQAFSLPLDDWLRDSKTLSIEVPLQALLDKRCRRLCWDKRASQQFDEPEEQFVTQDYCFYWFMVTRGYLGVDPLTEGKLEQRVRDLALQSSQPALAITSRFLQELITRKNIQKRSRERVTRNILEAKLKKFAQQFPEAALVLLDAQDDEGLKRKIRELSEQSIYTLSAILDAHLDTPPSDFRPSHSEGIAFLFNACCHLPQEFDPNHIWTFLAPFFPAAGSTNFFGFLNETIQNSKINPKIIFSTLQIIAFLTLTQSLKERSQGILKPVIEEHNGLYVIQLQVEGQTILLPLDPREALSFLCTQEPSEDILDSLMSFTSVINPLNIDPQSPLICQQQALNIDYVAFFEMTLKGGQQANPTIRRLSHDLLILCLGFPLTPAKWKEAVAAFPHLLEKENVEKERQRMVQAFKKRLEAHFGKSIVEKFVRYLERQAARPHAVEESIWRPLSEIRVEPFRTIGLEVIQRLIEGKRWTAQQACQAVQALLPLPREQQALYSLVDLLRVYSSHYQDIPVSYLVLTLLNAGFGESDNRSAVTFALICEEQKLLPESPLCRAVRLIRDHRAESLFPVIEELCKLWTETENEVISSLAKQLFNYLIKALPDQMVALNGYIEMVERVARQRADFVQPLVVEGLAVQLLKRGPALASLLVRCCTSASQDLVNYACSQRLWQEEDYCREFERLLTLNRTIRHREVAEQLHRVNPQHPELNEDRRLARVQELLVILHTKATPEGCAELLTLLKPTQEPQNPSQNLSWAPLILNNAASWGVEGLHLLTTLQSDYPQIDLESCLAQFFFKRNTIQELEYLARLLRNAPQSSVIDGFVVVCMQQLIVQKNAAAALELLPLCPETEAGLWLECLKGVLVQREKKKAALLNRAWETSLSYPRGNAFTGDQAFEFDTVQFQLLVALFFSENRDPKWQRLIEERIQGAVGPINSHHASSQFIERRLLGYLDLLTSQPFERFSSLSDFIYRLREAVVHIEGLTDPLFPVLEIRIVKGALRSNEAPLFLKGLQRLSVMARGEITQKEGLPLTHLAAKQVGAFVASRSEVVEPLRQLCFTYGLNGPVVEFCRLLEQLVSSSQPLLIHIAVDMALERAVDRTLSETYQKLLEELIRSANPRVREVLLHANSLFSGECLATQISDYLDAVMRARKNSADPIEGAPVALLNDLLPRLNEKSALRCVDKALDHLALVFEHSTAMLPCQEMWAYIHQIEVSDFSTPPQDQLNLPPNAELRAWLEGRNIRETLHRISPPGLLQSFAQMSFHHLLVAKLQRNRIDWTGIDKKIEEFRAKIAAEHPLLRLEIEKAAKGELALSICLKWLGKILEKRPQTLWARGVLMTALRQQFALFVKFYPKEHQKWIPLFRKFVFCPVAFEDEYVTLQHLKVVANLRLLMLRRETPLLFLYPDLKVEVEVLLDSQDRLTTKQPTLVGVQGLIQNCWDCPVRRESLPILQMVHATCQGFFAKYPSSQRKWYQRLMEMVMARRQTSWTLLDLLRRLCDDFTSQAEKTAKDCTWEIHKESCLKLIECLIEHLKNATIPQDEDQFVTHLQNFDAAVSYLDLANRQFLNPSNRAAFNKAKQQLCQTYGLAFDRFFDAILSRQDSICQTRSLVALLAEDFQNRGDRIECVREAHRRRWPELFERLAAFNDHDIEWLNSDDNIDMYAIGWNYHITTSRQFMTSQNHAHFVSQQRLLLASLRRQTQRFIQESQKLRPEMLLTENEINQSRLLHDIAKVLMDELQAEAASQLYVNWSETVTQLMARLRPLPITGGWMCVASFCRLGRGFYAEANQIENYFGAILDFAKLLMNRDQKSPKYCLYLFKMLTDPFPKQIHNEISKEMRAATLLNVLRLLETALSLYGAAAARLYAANLNAILRASPSTEMLALGHRENLEKILKMAPKGLLEDMQMIDLDNITEDNQQV